MPKLDERISSLELKLKHLKTRQQRIDARALPPKTPTSSAAQ